MDQDYERARRLMVDGQLRPSKVTDRRILAAMRRLPRERFVPAHLATLAYIDEDLPLGEGRMLMAPLVLARLLQLAAPRVAETVLVVGGGTGYGAAVLASCGVHVTCLEQSAALGAIARAACAGLGVDFVSGKLEQGCPDRGPFDLVVIEGAVRAIPPAIARQVAPSGRLVTVICAAGGTGVAVLAEPAGGALRAAPAFDASTPLLPELLPAPSFVF